MKGWFRFSAIFILILAYFLDWEKVQPIGMLVYSLAFLIDDFEKGELKRLDISTAYAGLLAITSISHMIAFFGWSENPWFFRKTYSGEISGKAIFIFNLGSILIIESMRTILKREKIADMVTSSMKALSVKKVFIVSIVIFLCSVYFNRWIQALGSFGSFFTAIINGSILLLSFLTNYQRKYRWIAFGSAMFLSIWALLFSYLRMEMLIPLIAYVSGDLFANRSIFKIHLYSKALLIGALIIFPPLFTYLGANRDNISNAQKIDFVLNRSKNEKAREGQTIMTRLSIIPQLSQIIMLTERKGFYHGKTLGYLAYVFIPRFIWTEKPTIKQGQWFAKEIGAAYEYRNGRINNSVNMTVPGEFYLNFGFIGVVCGCFLFGIFVGWLWNQTEYGTLYGWAFRFYLIFLGLFSLGADLQILPTLIAFLLVYKVIVYFGSTRSETNFPPLTAK